MSRQKAIVRLVRACKLPALFGKLLQARVCQGQLSPSHQLFEPNSLHSNQTVDIPNSLLLSCKKGQLFLPVYNFAEAPTWLRRGQILGWTQNAEVVDTDYTHSTTHLNLYPNPQTNPLLTIPESKLTLDQRYL